MGPFGLGDAAFDNYMIYFSVISQRCCLESKSILEPSMIVRNYAISWESFILLLGFLDLWRGWKWWDGFNFDLRVVAVLHWVSDLQNC
jgi:hypothetical protein